MKKEEVESVLSDVSSNYCWFRSKDVEIGDVICQDCKFFKDGKCTFNIWKWKGIKNEQTTT